MIQNAALINLFHRMQQWSSVIARFPSIYAVKSTLGSCGSYESIDFNLTCMAAKMKQSGRQYF